MTSTTLPIDHASTLTPAGLPPQEQLVAALDAVRGELEGLGFGGFELDDDGCDCCAGVNLTLPALAGRMRTYTSGRGRGPLANGWSVEVDIEEPNDGAFHHKTTATVHGEVEMSQFLLTTLTTTAHEQGLLPLLR